MSVDELRDGAVASGVLILLTLQAARLDVICLQECIHPDPQVSFPALTQQTDLDATLKAHGLPEVLPHETVLCWIARTLGMKAYFGPVNKGFGNAILTSLPVDGPAWFERVRHRKGARPRAMVHAMLRVTVPGGDGGGMTRLLGVTCLHLDHRWERTRLGQLNEVFRILHSKPVPAGQLPRARRGSEDATEPASDEETWPEKVLSPVDLGEVERMRVPQVPRLCELAAEERSASYASLAGSDAHFLLGDFNALGGGRYSSAEWNKIVEMRRKCDWEAPMEDVYKRIVEAEGYTDCWLACGAEGGVATCWAGSRIDYIFAAPGFDEHVHLVSCRRVTDPLLGSAVELGSDHALVVLECIVR